MVACVPGEGSVAARPTVMNYDRQGAMQRILSEFAARDRTIARRDLVISLAEKVVNETSVEKAVKELVDATYKVVNCDRVSLFLEEGGRLVCRAAPADGHTGWTLDFGHGIAGRVAVSGKNLNIPDAYERVDIFDATHDRETNYRTQSILCMAIRDKCGAIIGVLQAINKKDVDSKGFDRFVAFDEADEAMLNFLLQLTAQQLTLIELTSQKDEATRRMKTAMRLVQMVGKTQDLSEALNTLGIATRSLLNCEQAYVFFKEQGSFVCRAATRGRLGFRVELTEPVLGEVSSDARPKLYDKDRHPEDIKFLQDLLLNAERETSVSSPSAARSQDATDASPRAPMVVISALCMPMGDPTVQSEDLGVVLAINRKHSLSDAVDAAEAGKSETSVVRRSSLRVLLSQASELDADGEVRPFDESDPAKLEDVLRLVIHSVKTSSLYESERRSTQKLEALLSLLSEASSALEKKDPSMFASLILAKALAIFQCDRCTFFTVDNLNNELLGYYRGEESGSRLEELRIPMIGIAGCVAQTGSLLNIRDAWSDARFSNVNDLRTGYRTRTLLCAPLTTSSGKVIAVLQCVNKLRDEYFDGGDEKMLLTVSTLLSDLIQRLVLESSDKLVLSNDAIESDVKDMFKEYHQSEDATLGSEVTSPRQELPRRPSAIPGKDMHETIREMRTWTLDTGPMLQDSSREASCVRACFMHFNLLTVFGLRSVLLGSCLDALRSRYSVKAAYHNWEHALSTLHATFLLLDSWSLGGLMADEDILALLFAALGHDVDHSGFTNTYLVNTRHKLAMRYNDISVLENHHASITNRILADVPNLFESMTAEAVKRVRSVIVASILSTDMAKHRETLTWMESWTADLGSLRASGDKVRGDDALNLGKAVLHCADLVHPAMPWRVHRKRSKQIAAEFFAQFEEETKLGLPTLPFMGKDPSCLQGLAPIQVGFIQFVAAPLWSALNSAGGNDGLASVLKNIETNRKAWQQLGDGCEVEDDQPFMIPPRQAEKSPSKNSTA